MKRLILIPVLALMAASVCTAQTDVNYNRLYNNLVSRVGYDGLGVKILLDRWERDDDLDVNLRIAQFNYYMEKCRRDTIVTSTAGKYLGQSPVFSLKDSTGRKVNYFKQSLYDENLFRKAVSSLDKAIACNNSRFDLYQAKLDALMEYEKGRLVEMPAFLAAVIDRNYKGKTKWDCPGREIDDEVFCSVVQDYCHDFFNIQTTSSMEAFRNTSQLMLKYNPRNSIFMDNLGTHCLIVVKNPKKALKFYNKALKVNPSDSVAVKNIELIKKHSGSLAR